MSSTRSAATPSSLLFSHLCAAGVGLGLGVLLLRREQQQQQQQFAEKEQPPPPLPEAEEEQQQQQRQQQQQQESPVEEDPEAVLRRECGWLAPLLYEERYSRLQKVDDLYREWTDPAWRRRRGFLGEDFIHSRSSQGPRILRYFFDPATLTLIGVVKFGPNSESHAGLCHGGSMCAVLDDVCGHTAFISNRTGNWSGATIKVACSLKKPVRIGQVLKVWGRVRERSGRKSFIEGGLVAEDNAVHATLDGITVEVSREQLTHST